MLAGQHYGCNCLMGRCKCGYFCTILNEKARRLLHHSIPPASLQLRTGTTWATWSSGHAICEDSGSSMIMIWDSRKEPWAVPGLGRREGGCGVEDWGKFDVPARSQTEKICVGPFMFASVSARRFCHACRRSHHFDSFCGDYLLFAYVCSTGDFSARHRCLKFHCMRA